MHYYACYFVLATVNYNSFKDIMEKRHYINKNKACMLDMYGIIIFFPFFPLLAWKWTFEDLAHDIHTFDLQPHDFFEFETTTEKSITPEPSSLESLLLLLTALSYYEL